MSDLDLLIEDSFRDFIESPAPSVDPDDSLSDEGSRNGTAAGESSNEREALNARPAPKATIPDLEKLETECKPEPHPSTPPPRMISTPSKLTSRPIHGPSRRCTRRKPKGMPKRPLSAYNLFFKEHRPKLHKEYNEELGFKELGKMIGARWRALSEEERKVYEDGAQADVIRYHKAVDAYNESRRQMLKPRTPTKETSQVSPSFEDSYVTRARRVSLTESVHDTQPAPVTPLRVRARLPAPPFAVRGRFPGIPSQFYSGGPAPAAFSPQPSFNMMRPCPAFQTYNGQPQVVQPTTSFIPYRGENSQEVPASPGSLMMPPLEHAAYERGRMWPSPLGHGSTLPTSPSSVFTTGMQVMLPDEQSGKLKKYAVQYQCYHMSRTDADAYLQSLPGAGQARNHSDTAHVAGET